MMADQPRAYVGLAAIAIAAVCLLTVLSLEDATPTEFQLLSTPYGPAHAVVERACFSKECVTLEGGKRTCRSVGSVCDAMDLQDLSKHLEKAYGFQSQLIDQTGPDDVNQAIIHQVDRALESSLEGTESREGRLDVSAAKKKRKKMPLTIKFGHGVSPLDNLPKKQKERIAKYTKKRASLAKKVPKSR